MHHFPLSVFLTPCYYYDGQILLCYYCSLIPCVISVASLESALEVYGRSNIERELCSLRLPFAG